MEQISQLLIKGASELRRFRLSPASAHWGSEWLEQLAKSMESAAPMPERKRRVEIQTIARSLMDSGPSDEAACPSFWQIAVYQQRARDPQ